MEKKQILAGLLECKPQFLEKLVNTLILYFAISFQC